MINQATILGRVGKIETKYTGTGVQITNCSMVTSKKFMKDGEKTEKVTWHNVTLFNKLAEIAENYVNVGDMLYVQGEMDSQKYTTQDGQERTKFFIIANTLDLQPKSKEHTSPPKEQKAHEPSIVDDDIPW